MRQTDSESFKRQPFTSNSQNQERRSMNQSHASRKFCKCGECHNTSDFPRQGKAKPFTLVS